MQNLQIFTKYNAAQVLYLRTANRDCKNSYFDCYELVNVFISIK